eukprot:5961506-Pyramimonas_sp.AAC.1
MAAKTSDALYLYTETDMIAKKDTPLHARGAGKWLVDKGLKSAEEKHGASLAPFTVGANAVFTNAPQKFCKFLEYLEKTHAVTEHNLANHTVTRSDDNSAGLNARYTVKEESPC